MKEIYKNYVLNKVGFAISFYYYYNLTIHHHCKSFIIFCFELSSLWNEIIASQVDL